MRTAGSARWHLTAAAPNARHPWTSAHWCGGSARTASTCTASSSGLTSSRSTSTAPCAARSGNSMSDSHAGTLRGALPLFRKGRPGRWGRGSCYLC
uniref:Uncharacterized protein n=1 Tax=Amazona collaria TaxID=241587 RepID=A0A8B9F8P1_9PSIT